MVSPIDARAPQNCEQGLRMIKKRFGNISLGTRHFQTRLAAEGIEELIYPAFFLGVISQGQPVTHENEFRDGQFVMSHIYAGTACSNRHLRGIFMPLSICKEKDTPIIQALTQVASTGRYDQALMNKIGPLNLMPFAGGSSDGSNEALLWFTNSDEIYPWLKSHEFKYVTEFIGPDTQDLRVLPEIVQRVSKENLSDPGDIQLALGIVEAAAHLREIGNSNSLTWSDTGEFARWLSCDGKIPLERQRYIPHENRYVVEPAQISAAFIYANSD